MIVTKDKEALVVAIEFIEYVAEGLDESYICDATETLKNIADITGKKQLTSNCKTCGNPFHYNRSSKVYCSNACKMKAYRKQKPKEKHEE